jgi:hypothetical protein
MENYEGVIRENPLDEPGVDLSDDFPRQVGQKSQVTVGESPIFPLKIEEILAHRLEFLHRNEVLGGKTKIFGGIILNHAVGGINPVAAFAAIRFGAKEIKMPTVHAQKPH